MEKRFNKIALLHELNEISRNEDGERLARRLIDVMNGRERNNGRTHTMLNTLLKKYQAMTGLSSCGFLERDRPS